MKKINKKMTVLGLTMFFIGLNGIGYSPLAFAQGGDKIGGGGDVLTCIENGKKNYYLLDTYEAIKRGGIIQLGSNQLSVEQKLELAIAFYSTLDPVRAAKYSIDASKMLQDLNALEQGQKAPNGLVIFDSPLRDIDDAGEAFLYRTEEQGATKDQCSKGQLVRQETPVSVGEPRYTVDQKHWKLLDRDQRVATVLHEVIYKDFRDHGVYLSKSSRYLNGRILTNQILNYSQRDYVDFLKSNNAETYMLGQNFNVLAGTLIFDAEGSLTQLNGGYQYKFGKITFKPNKIHFRDSNVETLESASFYSIDGDQLTISNSDRRTDWMYAEGVLKFQADGTLSISNIEKSGGGNISVIIDLNGKIISRQETGYYHNTPIFIRDELRLLYACLKPLSKNGVHTDVLQSFVQKARVATGNNDFSAISALVSECKASSQTALLPESDVSSQAKTIVQWLETKPSKKSVVICKGFEVGATATAILGVEVSVIPSMTCTYMDGTRRVFAGLGGGFVGGGLGAEVKVGKFTYVGTDGFEENITYRGPGTEIGGLVNVTGGGDDTSGTLIFSKGGGDGDSGTSIKNEEYRLGLHFYMVKFQGKIVVRIGKKQDDFDTLINMSVVGLIAPVQP